MTEIKLPSTLRKDVNDALGEVAEAAESPGWEGIAIVVLGHRTAQVPGRHARDTDKHKVNVDVVDLEFAVDPADADILRNTMAALHRKNTAHGTLDEGSADDLALQHTADLIDSEGDSSGWINER